MLTQDTSIAEKGATLPVESPEPIGAYGRQSLSPELVHRDNTLEQVEGVVTVTCIRNRSLYGQRKAPGRGRRRVRVAMLSPNHWISRSSRSREID